MASKTINIEYAFAILFVLFFQIIVASRAAIGGITADMGLIVVVWIALVKPPQFALVFGFACGFFVGILTPADFGWAALMLAFTGFGLSTLKEKLVMESMQIRILTLFIVALLYHILFLSLSRFDMISGDFAYIFINSFFSSVYTTGVGILVYIFIQHRYLLRNMF